MKNCEKIKYPVGVQTFEKIREGNFLYVDKTSIIYSLIQARGFYFLSRPRRFGKSLLLSTLEAYYRGRRDLFKGLALDSLTEEWEPHAVLHIDLNYGKYDHPDDLMVILSEHLDKWEAIYGKTPSTIPNPDPHIRFNQIIRRAAQKTEKKVVILVDEYDKPLLNAFNRPDLADIYRSQLKAFYANLKSMDAFIEMAMLTGVARFSKVSIFSDLNNLRDISFDDKFASICGITSEELDIFFQSGMKTLAESLEMDTAHLREELRRHYDGYHFSRKSPDIYNPFSLVNVFAANRISDFWFSSGTPSFLVSLLEGFDFRYKEISPVTIDSRYLESAGLLDSDPIPAFYQTGYLTIKEYDREFKEFTLAYPNEEVKYGFLEFLMRSIVPAESLRGFSIPDFVREVRSGRPEAFMKRMESLIASVPYSENGSAEGHFQNAVYLLFTLLGQYTRMEDRTSDGRIDLQVETSKYIYIFEFKINSTSEKAMEQIREKKYWLRDAVAGKEIFLIGANFNTSTRRLTSPLISKI